MKWLVHAHGVMYMMTEKDHGGSENVVGVVDVLVRGGVAMYERASGMPCVRLSNRWVGMVHGKRCRWVACW